MAMKLKKKTKKRKIFILLFLLLIYLSSFLFTVKYYLGKDSYSKIIDYLIENESNYVSKKKDNKPFTKLLTFIANVDFNDPLTLISSNYDINEDIKPKEEIKRVVNEIEIKEELDLKNPICYIYNTHQKEEYAFSNKESYNVRPTVLTASYMLREKLNRNSIATIVEETNITDLLNINGWNYASSYKISRMLLEDAKSKNNSLKYFIDLHRDSVNKNISTVTINDKKYAKILFIVGLENSNYQANLDFTEDLNTLFNDRYPNLSRGIYKKKGKGVNGVYNQDFSPRTILIEVGGQDNTIDEVNNTIEAISEVLTFYIKEENYGE